MAESRALGRFETRNRRNGSFDADVIGMRRPATDANSMTLTNPAVISGTPCDGKIQISPAEFFHRRSAFRCEPRVDDLSNTLFQWRGLEGATVKENRRWMNELSAGELPGQLAGSRERNRLTREKSSQVLRDGRILRIRQRNLRDTGAAACLWLIAYRNAWKEAFDQDLLKLLAIEFRFDCPADERGASAGD